MPSGHQVDIMRSMYAVWVMVNVRTLGGGRPRKRPPAGRGSRERSHLVRRCLSIVELFQHHTVVGRSIIH